MENKLYYSPKAIDDLDEIWDYISLSLLNPVAAQNTVDGILSSIEKLKIFSKAGSALIFFDGTDSGYRYVQYGNYLAFYRTDKDEVFIDRIIYGKRDYMKILFDDIASE